MSSPYEVTKQFESALCEYTGAPFAVAVNSCTAALLLAIRWNVLKRDPMYLSYDGLRVEANLPKRTYVSVPMAAIHANAYVTWRDEMWRGEYQISPLPVWDCARRFTGGMYRQGQFQCVSFSASKILSAEQGGAIMHDNEEADAWFRRMRFDGRTEGMDPMEDTFDLVGHHLIMLPSVAAGLLLKLYHLPKHNEDLPEREYPDLSKHPAFK